MNAPDDRLQPEAIRANEPGMSPQLPPLVPNRTGHGRSDLPLSNLGDLAQKAREKPLRHARGWLLFVGIASTLVNLALLINLSNEVQTELAKMPANIDRQAAEAAMVSYGLVLYGGPMLLGIAFIVLGCLVMRYPLPTTITSLVLYIAGNAIFALLNPLSLVSGFIIKIIVVVVLVNAVRAASAYEQERRDTQAFQPES